MRLYIDAYIYGEILESCMLIFGACMEFGVFELLTESSITLKLMGIFYRLPAFRC